MSETQSALAGKRIVVTRAASQADELDDLLRLRGAEPLSYPCIAVAPPADAARLDAALCSLAGGEFAWLVLTSRNTVAALAERLDALGLNLDGVRELALASVGAATARAAEAELGVRSTLVPDEFVAEALAGELVERIKPGERVLLPQAEIARPVVAEALQAAGADVTSVVAYRTVTGSGGVNLPALLAINRAPEGLGGVDAITFTSGSTVRNFLRRLAAEGGRSADVAGLCIACLGPVTAEAARKLGLAVHVVPAESTIPAFVDALESYFCR